MENHDAKMESVFPVGLMFFQEHNQVNALSIIENFENVKTVKSEHFENIPEEAEYPKIKEETMEEQNIKIEVEEYNLLEEKPWIRINENDPNLLIDQPGSSDFLENNNFFTIKGDIEGPKNLKIRRRKRKKNALNLFKCNVCNYLTTVKRNLKSHLKVKHADTSAFKCDKCDYSSKFESYLKRHLKKHISKTVCLLNCDQCDYSTKDKNYLRRHFLRMHRKQNLLFKCDECDYSTVQLNNLKRHNLVHMGTDQLILFKCDQCDYTTKYKHHLKLHLEIKHFALDTIRLKCEKCDYSTRVQFYLRQHFLKVHNKKK